MQPKSWKTTTAGILIIVGAGASCVSHLLTGAPCDYPATWTAVVAGLGLIGAGDHSAIVAAVSNFVGRR